MDFCLASDERDYKEEVIFSPYIIGNTDGNVLPVKIDLNSPDNSELFVLDYDVYNPYNILVSSNYYNPDDLDLSCFSGFSALCDVGLTGIDNGLVREMTGQTAYITKGINDFTKFDRLSFDRRMKFFQVTGYTQPPNIRFSGIPKNDNYSIVSYQKDAGVYHELYGGFYQGFYKLYGYDYEVLPERVHHGWSAEFLLRPRIWDDYFPTSGDTTLNDVYPNNAGIFFYMGARAENKFYHYASGSPSGFTAYTRVTESLVSSQTAGTTGETTCLLTCGCSDSGNTMSQCGPVYPPQNYITNVTPCETSQITAPELNPSGDSCSNNFAVKFSGDPGNPKICVRVLRLTDECTIDQCTSAKTYTSGCTVQEYCTPKGINYFCENTDYIKFEHWVQVDVVFERYRDMDECHLWWDGGLGVITNFKYTASTYNESVTLIQPPYTHINVESGDTTPIETPYGREIVELNNKWLQQKDYRLGRLKIYVNGRRFHTFENFEEVIPRPLDTEREKQIGVPFNLSWGGGTQGLRENLTFKDCPVSSVTTTTTTSFFTSLGNIYQQDPELFPDSVLSGTSLSGLNTNIVLEKYFAGTFDGGISQFNYYIKPMTADEVKHNYKLNKTRYNLFDWDCPNCDVLVPECDLSAVVYEYTTTTTTIPITTTTTTVIPLCDITYDIVPLPTCLEYFVTDDGFYLITEDGNFIVTENDPCCFDNLLDENGDIMITENGQYLIFDNGNCITLTLDAYYNPGSVVIDYVLLSSSIAPDEVSVSFTNTLGVLSGSPIEVKSSVTLLSGNTSGSTQVILPSNFSNLDGTSTFANTNVSQSGGSFSFNVNKNPIFPQPTPTPSVTPTSTPTPTPTPSFTPTLTPTQTPTQTSTPTPTPTPSFTPTLTPTPTLTLTPSPSFIPTIPFISIWRTTGSSETITLPYENTGTYNGTIDWGDGNTSVNSYANRTHTYTTPGDYIITISGDCVGFRFNDSDDKIKIIEITQWGNKFRLGNTGNAYFYGCSNLTLTGVTDTLNLTGTASLISMFGGCINITTIPHINSWDMSGVQNTALMFFNTKFNSDISNWDMSNVDTMNLMFAINAEFNQNINGWDVSNVTNMSSMFFSATSFNQDISSWNVSGVTNMSSMFSNSPFNQDISSWNVSGVTNMSSMFSKTPFNQDISGWDVSNVTDMSNLFFSATSFNQDISSWNVSGVTNMGGIFWSATTFNRPLNGWNVSNTTNMYAMFQGATSFNQDISGWDVSNVTDFYGMGYMFKNATNFNRDLSSWCVPLIPSLPDNFDTGASSWVLPKPIWGTCPPFISIWRTTGSSETVTLPYYDSGTYDGIIDWGDGNTSVNSYVNRTHTYATPGDYTITISGNCVGWGGGSVLKIIEITQWGSKFRLGNNGSYFYGCSNLVLTGLTDTLNLEGTTLLNFMFMYCNNITTIPNINNWDVSNVTSMSYVFGQNNFNSDISNWDVSNVTNMYNLFYYCPSFNQDISSWNVSNVTNMGNMFYGCESFNQDISSWNVSGVTNMSGMFGSCYLFNQDISGWDVSNVTDMGSMFGACYSFNQDISSWNVSSVTNMNGMFASCNLFNQDINGWDVSNVMTMNYMFISCVLFNQDLSSWCVPLIPSEPELFDNNTPSWVLPKPIWGTCTIVVNTLWNGATSINSNQLKLTKTPETLLIQVNYTITDNLGNTSFVGIVSSDDTYTYVFTGPGGGVAFDCQFPLTFTGS
jgi:surface protein